MEKHSGKKRELNCLLTQWLLLLFSSSYSCSFSNIIIMMVLEEEMDFLFAHLWIYHLDIFFMQKVIYFVKSIKQS